MTTEHVALII